MNPITQIGKVLMSKGFWLHAGAVLIGFKACDAINALVAAKADFIPDAAVPFVGPAVVIASAPLVGKFAGEQFGAYLIVGAGLHVVDSLLGLVGVPQGSIRQE